MRILINAWSFVSSGQTIDRAVSAAIMVGDMALHISSVVDTFIFFPYFGSVVLLNWADRRPSNREDGGR